MDSVGLKQFVSDTESRNKGRDIPLYSKIIPDEFLWLDTGELYIIFYICLL